MLSAPTGLTLCLPSFPISHQEMGKVQSRLPPPRRRPGRGQLLLPTPSQPPSPPFLKPSPVFSVAFDRLPPLPPRDGLPPSTPLLSHGHAHQSVPLRSSQSHVLSCDLYPLFQAVTLPLRSHSLPAAPPPASPSLVSLCTFPGPHTLSHFLPQVFSS